MIRLDIGVDYWSGIRTSMNARRGSVAVHSADSVVPADVGGRDMGDDLTMSQESPGDQLWCPVCDAVPVVLVALRHPVMRRWTEELLVAEHGCWDVATMADRSEEHTSELQSLMRNSYAVF